MSIAASGTHSAAAVAMGMPQREGTRRHQRSRRQRGADDPRRPAAGPRQQTVQALVQRVKRCFHAGAP